MRERRLRGPERRRQAKALQIIGFKYDEIGERLGVGHTRVNHLVSEANAAIRKEHERLTADRRPLPPRAERLQELEQRPPVEDGALGSRPTEPRAARSYDLAQGALTRVRDTREVARRRSLER